MEPSSNSHLHFLPNHGLIWFLKQGLSAHSHPTSPPTAAHGGTLMPTVCTSLPTVPTALPVGATAMSPGEMEAPSGAARAPQGLM